MQILQSLLVKKIRLYISVFLLLGASHSLSAQTATTAYTARIYAQLLPYIKEAYPQTSFPRSFITSGLMYEQNHTLYIKVMIECAEETSPTLPSEILIQSKVGNIWSVHVPLNKLDLLMHHKNIKLIDFAKPVHSRLKAARADIGVNRVHQGINLPKAYTGKNVIVGVVDYGLDFLHPTFQDAQGKTRVKSVWMQSSTTGTPPAGYNYGEELKTTAAIEAAEASSLDESHGSMTTSIAAGNGGKDSTFRGIAPEADIVFVDLQGTDQDLIDAVNYIFTYATTQGKPAVVNLSLGMHIGPHDGTSLADKALDLLAGAGKIICGAAGNEGEYNIHIQHSFHNDTVKTILMFSSDTATIGDGVVDLWADSLDAMRVSIGLVGRDGKLINRIAFFDVSTNVYSYKGFKWNGDSITMEISAAHKNPNNGKSNVQLYINNQTSAYATLYITALKASAHLWNDGLDGGGGIFANELPNVGVLNGFSAGNNEISVGELGGTGKKIITAGSYATTNKFTNLSLVVQDYTNEVTLNDISTFSSRGATVDGRIKPDITAPGDFVAAAVNSYDPNYTATSDNVVAKVAIGGIDFFYAAEQGTSFSCPMVVGVVALMLEADRNLTPEQAKNIIQTTARQDNYTKTITSPGSNIWGWGKLNAYGAVYKTATGIADNSKASSINVYPIPASNELLIDQSNIQFSSAAYAHIIDMQGQVVAQFNYMDIKLGRLNVRQLNQGMYILQLVDGAFSATQKIIITH